MKRRIFLKASGASAALVPGATEVFAQKPARPAASSPGGDDAGAATYLFFNAPEAAFVEAAVVRLIPPDELGPSALQAAVPTYIDRQLHGAWGAGERLYRSGPWPAGTPQQGYQLPFTPAELWRTALRAIDADLQQNGGTAFHDLQGPQQDAYLTQLQTGSQDLGGVPCQVFFDTLLAMTIEGYFSDPVYGGNKDMAAWAMIGFPGAYAAYYDTVDQYGLQFQHPPRSLAQDAQGRVMAAPDIPAYAPMPHPHGKGR